MAVIKCLSGTKSLEDMLSYLENEGKTLDHLRSGINCTSSRILTEFSIVKEMYNKLKGKQYYHITQAFSPEDDITPEKAHDIGVRWMEENIQDHQIYIVTHIDRDHIHNHFVINSVNFENGKKLQINPKKLEKMKESSNKICREEGLSTINLDKSYGDSKTDKEYRLESSGVKTWKSFFRESISMSLEHSSNISEFVNILKDNFDIEAEFTDRSVVFKKEDIIIRGSKLGGSYSRSGIIKRIN
ncbi:Relaxase/Mobilisation nuclease domain-containing protein [Clostridium sp. DSM 8431]|uniref:relaxase/mobilization nuclease domain-containing protein n=1 Tax=Clostridium sp. DSM 8431 TaxID=1761781 RepID=UPI0008EF325B|nr:relaxase/mobilization nuclease domain-containing protein [Clostridium sp. DSM 8431]SFU61882.1 Relaxase/Mobilisation nuclease domain-containing protein [Clostridium sp. DSM 8431]